MGKHVAPGSWTVKFDFMMTILPRKDVYHVHNGVAREQISIPQAIKTLDAKVAMHNKWTT